VKNRIPDCHRNVENFSIGGDRARFPYTARGFGDAPRRPPVAKTELTTTDRMWPICPADLMVGCRQEECIPVKTATVNRKMIVILWFTRYRKDLGSTPHGVDYKRPTEVTNIRPCESDRVAAKHQSATRLGTGGIRPVGRSVGRRDAGRATGRPYGASHPSRHRRAPRASGAPCSRAPRKPGKCLYNDAASSETAVGARRQVQLLRN